MQPLSCTIMFINDDDDIECKQYVFKPLIDIGIMSEYILLSVSLSIGEISSIKVYFKDILHIFQIGSELYIRLNISKEKYEKL